MKRRCAQFEVYANEAGGISITQEVHSDVDQMVEIAVEQVPLLVQWLQEITKDIQTEKESAG